MHMGELKFKQRPREEQAECEDAKGSSPYWSNESFDKLSSIIPKVPRRRLIDRFAEGISYWLKI